MKQTEQLTRIPEFLELLQEYNMQDHAQDILELLEYVSGMDHKCDLIMKELRQVKELLAKQGQKQDLENTIHNIAQKIENGVTYVRGHLHNIRDTVKNFASDTVDSFHKKGVLVLQKTAGFLGVRKMLDEIGRDLNRAANGVKQTMEHLESMGKELRLASGHIRNAARAARGRELQTVEQQPEGVIQSTLLLPIREIHKTLLKMQSATDSAICNVERFEQYQEQETDAQQLNLQAEYDFWDFTIS